MKRFMLPLIAASALVLTGCSSAAPTTTETALHYKGGLVQGKSFAGCVDPGTKDFNGPGDTHFSYPIDLRSFDATGGPASESGAIEVLSAENEPMLVPVTVSFYLKPDCENVRAFHETIGDKYNAYNDNGEVTQGWVDMLHYSIGQPLNTTLDRITQDTAWKGLMNNEIERDRIEKTLAREIPTLIQRQTGNQQFFERFQVIVQKPVPKNPGLLQAISDQQQAAEQGRAEEAKASAAGRAAVAKAQADIDAAAKAAEARNAEVAVQAAEAAKRRAEISGYGSVEEYNRAKAVEKGINPYQPTYVVPQAG